MKEKILEKISGDAAFSLRHKILNAIFFILATYLLITAVTNLFIEENVIIRIGTFAISFIFYFVFYLTRVKKLFSMGHFIAVLTLFMLFIYHKYDGGLGCGTGFYIVITAIGIVSMFTGRAVLVYLSALSVVSLFFVFAEVFYPGYVLPVTNKTCFVNNVLAFLLTAIGGGLIVYVFASTYEEYAVAKEKLSFTDHLTGLMNRRAFFFELKNKIPLFLRRKIPFCFVMFDCDDFKKINDTYGHNCGDVVLKKLTEKVSSLLKTGDMLCRWGGEEFLIFLPYSDKKQGKKVAERLRKSVEEMIIPFKDKKINITVTLGVREFNNNVSIDKNIEFADMAMYKGKQMGKNIVVLA